MSTPLRLAPRTFPARLANLGFTALFPEDWVSHELPAEDVDFSDATAMAPLAVITAPQASLIYALAARPAFGDGTLTDWALYLLSQQGLKPRTAGIRTIAAVPGIVGESVQTSELGPMVVRFAFLEDGGRLLSLSLIAPEFLADAVANAWSAFLGSFTLTSPRGATAAPPQGLPFLDAAAAPEATAPEPAPASSPTAPAATTGPDAGSQSAVSAEPEVPAGPFLQFALAETGAALDPEHPINANLRDRGVGLVPRVVVTDDAGRKTTVASGALAAQLDIPHGWHAIDDGRRVLVFEPGGAIQIHLDPLPGTPEGVRRVLDRLESEARRDYPNPHLTRDRDAFADTLIIRNIADGSQPLEQVHRLVPGRNPQTLLRARITSTPERSAEAVRLGTLIQESVSFDHLLHVDEPVQPASDRPVWWNQAKALEQEGRLEEAEKVIRDAVPHLGALATVAQLHRERMERLLEAGDRDGARSAFLAADSWIHAYAAGATSGGEGAALSQERDEFRAGLVQCYGGDPKGP